MRQREHFPQSQFWSEVSGSLTTLMLISVVLVLVGFIPTIGGIVGFLASTRLWLTGMIVLLAVFSALLTRRFRRSFYFIVLAILFAATTVSLPSVPNDGLQLKNTVEVKVINFNVLESNIENGQVISEFLMDAGADIIVIEEALPLKPHLQILTEKYPFQGGCNPQGRCDLLLLSKFELEEVRVTSLGHDWKERAIFAVVKINEVEIGIAAIHLTKPYFDNVSINELARITRELKGLPENKIVLGDFNSASWAPDQIKMLNNNGLKGFWREPATWPVLMGDFGVAIDHIYASGDGIQIDEVKAIEDAFGSNHRGLIGWVLLDKY